MAKVEDKERGIFANIEEIDRIRRVLGCETGGIGEVLFKVRDMIEEESGSV